MRRLLLVLALSVVSYGQQWSMGYYAGSGMPVAHIDWRHLTHVIHSIGIVQSDCSIDVSTNGISTYGAALVAAAHANGAKAIVSFNQAYWNGDTTSMYNCSRLSLSTLVTNMMSVVTTYGYDGIDIDWEPFIEATHGTYEVNLLTALRASLGSSRILLAAVSVDQYTFWNGTNTAMLDKVDVMTYDLEGTFEPQSYFVSPLYGDSTSYWSLDLAATRFVAAGISANKICFGIPFYGASVTNPQLPRQAWNTPTITQLAYTAIRPQITGPNYNFDATTHTPYLILVSSYITYENPQSITDKINYIFTNHYGGWFVFILHDDYFVGETPEHPLWNAIVAAIPSGVSVVFINGKVTLSGLVQSR